MLFPMTIVMMFLKGGNTRFLTTTAHSLGVSHLVRVQPYQRKLISHQEDNLPTHSSLVSTGCLKVSKNRNDFMNTSFFPKSINLMYGQYSRAVSNQEQVIVAHICNRALILTIISLVFGRNDVFIKSFRFLLIFNKLEESPQIMRLQVLSCNS